MTPDRDPQPDGDGEDVRATGPEHDGLTASDVAALIAKEIA